MFLLLKFLLSCCLIGASYAKSEAEVKIWLMTLGLECNMENPISAEDLHILHSQHKVPDNDNAKCLLACVYKKAKWIDEKGMFDVESAKTMMDKEHIDDATKAENAKKLFDECKKVNDEATTDGEKGCQRAASLTTCFTENCEKMGFKLPTSLKEGK